MISLALFGQMLFGALCGLEYIAILAGESQDAARSIGRSVCLRVAHHLRHVHRRHQLRPRLLPRPHRLHRTHPADPPPCPRQLRSRQSLRHDRDPARAVSPHRRRQLHLHRSHPSPHGRRLGPPHPQLVHPPSSPLPHADQLHRLHLRARLLLLILANIGVHAQEAFQVLSNAAITHYEIAYIAMFAIPLIGAKALRTRLPRWLRWTSIAGLCATLFSFIISAYPFVDVVNPRAYAAKILGTTLLSNIIGYTFYRIRNRRPASNATHSILSNISNDMR